MTRTSIQFTRSFTYAIRPEHFGWEVASLPSRLVTEEAIRACLEAHSTNPDIVGACMLALIKKGLLTAFTDYALKYLTSDNGFSDVIRLAVVEALPSAWPTFNLATFLALRLSLVDDDEDVRTLALGKVEAFLGVSNLSLPGVLELLHRHAAKHLGQVYLDWREAFKPSNKALRDNSALLFAAEPFNLFATPSWECGISLD